MSMGVYIEGIEMPKEIEPALVIEFCEDLDGKRYARFYHYSYGGLTDWHEVLEFHEPHGRLIDADALIADLKRQCKEVFRIDAVSPDDFWITRNEAYNERLWTTWCESLGDYINAAPTIIEAGHCAEPCNDLAKPNKRKDGE